MPSTPEQPTAETVRRVLGARLPDGASVRPADEPPFTWWVGDKYVLRLAHDKAASTRRRRELRLRELVRPHVSVAVPTGVATGEWAPGLAYALDTRLPGASAQEREVTAAGEEDLAGLLAALRAVPVARAAQFGVPKVAPRSLERLRQQAGPAAQKLDDKGEFDAERLRQLTAQAVAQLGPQGEPVLVHHGLSGEHLIVTPDGHVAGALGWGDALIGDPAEDIACLAAAVGARAAVRSATLAGYGPRACLRGLWLGRCDAVVRLAEGLLGGAPAEPTALLRVRLERVWEPILLELVSEG
ncbi:MULTISPECIES: aminoglycoside phosphotransferase family protein [unclassified Streptomyces]|uniref:aminoglycoside phosphotransferase family protein n=1 Tax=unclassified Streptomyces TaxID=2593676 RepID=UPI00278BE9CF|nr:MULTISPECIES: aminoglycoside phosphotransferase family protein [unclassified Streptomyces]